MRSGLLLTATSAAVLPFIIHTACAAPAASTTSIQWFSCPQNETAEAPYDCGTLDVPLDYTNESAGTLELKMVRVNHTKEPFMGSILFNFGGPGISARSSLAFDGASFLELTGGHFDLVGHDPRGTGDTIPYICQNASAVVPVHSHADASDVAPGMIFTDRYVLAQTCLQEQAEYGELVGTAFTARDLMRIVDALGEDGLLRFWGISYGSALGAAAAAMFPDRMDRVVLDAVLNQHQYWEGLDYEQPAKADGALHLFCEACIEGGETCILSQYASTADELERKIYDLFDSVRHQPLALGPTNAAVVRYDMLKTNVVTGLRIPTALWQINAMMLDSIFTPNATMYQETTAILTGLFDGEEESWPELGIEGGCGIRCSDSSFRSNSLEDLYPVIEGYQNVSKLAGAFLVGPGPMTCSQWPFEAKERVEWTGGYETRHPLLFVGNTYDPLTPVDSAYNASADFPGSAVVEQNSSGHASINHPSSCTANVIRNYFVNGTLPETGLICEPDEPLGIFTPTNATLSKRSTMSEEDAKLSDAMARLSKRMLGARF